MLIQKHGENLHGGITPKTLYFNRRQLLAGLPAAFLGARELLSPSGAQAAAGLGALAKSRLSTSEKASPFKDVATYNNFYEEPARNSPRNWPKTSRRAPGSFRWKAKPESRARSQWRKSSKSRHSGQWYRSYGNELWEFDEGVATLERRSIRWDKYDVGPVRCGIANNNQSRRRGRWLGAGRWPLPCLLYTSPSPRD